MSDSEEPLVTRRSKRSTAGNRMEAALAELTLDDAKDGEEDKDFYLDKDEEDIFESDFASTDEEAEDAEGETGEGAAREEDRQARKAVRLRLERATAAAHARQKATFHPHASTSTSPPKPRTGSRLSLGQGLNAATGGAVPAAASTSPQRGAKRHSKRKHTVLNTSATVTRMKHAEERRAAFIKKAKVQIRTPTQAELIARALDNEEGNIVSHRDYLRFEEEKRKRAQVVRASVRGPLLKWISRGEDTKVVIPPPPAPPIQPSAPYPGGVTTAATTLPYPYSGTVAFYNPYMTGSVQPPPPSLPPPQPTIRVEKVNKNYVVHELGQYETVPQPLWQETMTAMFGDHVKWEDLKVYVTKGRPFSRPRQTCPLTGLPARYLDPRTKVPFANARAYETLTRVLAHRFVWSAELGCYVGAEDDTHANGIQPKRADEAMDVTG